MKFSCVWLLSLSSMFFAACAATREYRCPEPIGFIVRDDCEAYRNRYEAARVGLSAGVAQFQVQAEFSEKSLRDPSEFIQVMNQRLMTLCHDFNACRLSAEEYRRRRDELDQTMTALVALTEQLKRSDLGADERKLLLEKLIQLFGAPAGSAPSAAVATTTPVQGQGKVQSPAQAPRAYYGSDPWFESRFLPPQAPPVAKGMPRLVWPWHKFVIENAWVPKSPDRPHDMKLGGYAPRPMAVLWGKFAADDLVEFRLPNGKSLSRPVRKNAEGVLSLWDTTPKDWVLTSPEFFLEVLYRLAGDDVIVPLGKMKGRVLEESDGGWKLDFREDLDKGWLFFAPQPLQIPAPFERPYIYVTLQLRKYEREVTARCFQNDRPITGAMKPERFSGQSGTYQDRPRYRKVDEHTSEGVKEPFVEWWHYVFALPFLAPVGSDPLPEGFGRWPPEPGKIKCVVKIQAEPVRELEFEVGKDGRLEPLEGQRGQPGDLVHPWWKVRTRVIPNQQETVLEEKASS